MATENNSQINSFNKGMNSDVSYSMLQDGQYTFARNIRITQLNQDGSGNLTNGQGVIRPIEGVQVYNTSLTPKRILATNSIRNIGIIIYVDSDDHWKVAVFENGKPTEITTIFDSEETATVDKFSTVVHHEADNLDKIYIADSINPIKLLLIKKEHEQWKYITKDEVESYPKVIFEVPKFEGLIDGTLKAGMVQYAYRLYKKYSIASDMSPTTNLIPIINKQSLSGLQKDYTSNCGIKISIDNRSVYEFYDSMQVYRIMYVENGQLPTIELIYDDLLSRLEQDQERYYISDVGQLALSTLTLEEFNSISGIHIIPKVLESKNDYMFAAQIKDVQSSVFEGVTKDTLGAKIDKFVILDLIGDASLAVNNGINHNTIQRSAKLSTWNFDYNESDSKYRTILKELEDNPTYSNPKVSYYLKSLRRGEIYRYGVVLYDIRGNSSGVIYIGDVDTKDVDSEKPLFEFGTNYELVTHPVGIKISFDRFPQNAVAYEIVRCRRTESDVRNIAQGVLSRPWKKYKMNGETLDDSYPYTPTGLVTMQDLTTGFDTTITVRPKKPLLGKILDNENIHADNLDNATVLQFISPEVSYLGDSFISQIQNRDIQIQIKSKLYQPLNRQNTLVFNDDLSISDGVYHAAWHNLSFGFKKWNYPNDQFAPQLSVWNPHNTMLHGFMNQAYSVDGTTEKLFSYIKPTNEILSDAKVIRDRISNDIKNIKQHSFAYIKLYGVGSSVNTGNFNTIGSVYDVNNCVLSNTLQWNDLWERQGENLNTNKYIDFTQNIGTEEYNNTVIGGYYDELIHFNESEGVANFSNELKSFRGIGGTSESHFRVFASTGGKCAVLKLKSPIDIEKHTNLELPTQQRLINYHISDQYLYTYLVNITKTCIPYGGNDEATLKNNIYYSYGDYHTVNDTSCVVFNGDTFIEPFEYISMHKQYYSPAANTVPSHMIAYSIPVETSINLAYTHGDEFSRIYNQASKPTNIQVEPASVYNVYAQDKPLYSYNSVYSTNTTAKLFAPKEDEDSNTYKNLDYRVYFSNLKTNGEYIDNWLKYQPANYLDVDSKHGEITHLRTFQDKLLFWQSQATGLLSVNERAQITDDSNLPLILGTGGILDRYDYLDGTAGMKKEEYCDAISSSTLYWYDSKNNEIKSYSGGNGITPLTKVLGVQNIINAFGNSNEIPWMFYDKKYNEVVTKFNRNTNNKSIAYNEVVRAFTSMYSVGFEGSITFSDGLYLLNKDSSLQIGKWNEGNVSNFSGPIFSHIQYVVNKNPLTTKTFDNQEIVTEDLLENRPPKDTDAYFSQHHKYSWKTDLNATGELENIPMTLREGNYRFAVPRANKAAYGDRMRGKYMICTIEDTAPNTDASIAYIITKFRTSWS